MPFASRGVVESPILSLFKEDTRGNADLADTANGIRQADARPPGDFDLFAEARVLYSRFRSQRPSRRYMRRSSSIF